MYAYGCRCRFALHVPRPSPAPLPPPTTTTTTVRRLLLRWLVFSLRLRLRWTLHNGDDRGGVKTRRCSQQVVPSCFQTSGKPLERGEARTQALQLFPHAGILRPQPLHLSLELHFLLLQGFALGHPLDPATGGIAPVLQRASALLQFLDFISRQATQEEVQFPDRQRHELAVWQDGHVLATFLLDLWKWREGQKMETPYVFCNNRKKKQNILHPFYLEGFAASFCRHDQTVFTAFPPKHRTRCCEKTATGYQWKALYHMWLEASRWLLGHKFNTQPSAHKTPSHAQYRNQEHTQFSCFSKKKKRDSQLMSKQKERICMMRFS